MYNNSVFIFRRDLRLSDNIGLIKALEKSKKVYPIFIFTPDQLKKNPYKSDNCVQFMMESLDDLDKQLKKKRKRLIYFYGKPVKVIEKLLKKGIDGIFFNNDYTAYSHKRDAAIIKLCKSYQVPVHIYEDLLLQPVGSVRTGSGTIYTKFTPYFNKAKKVKVPNMKKNNKSNYSSGKLPGEYKKDIHIFYQYNKDIAVNGGRTLGLKQLNKSKKFRKYNKERNTLIIPTTQLSAYIKFGCISIREVYWKFKDTLGTKNDLIKQLYWRDFYANLSNYFPYVYTKNGAMKKQYNNIKWKNNKLWFNKWKNGETGYPIVDAAMRQLNKTGFMHNRGRLITSNFLIKILQINWKWGEKYFAQKLVDYDPPSNNGNWQWSSSSGADSQPYFRIFNPWTQGKRFDEDAEYIKHWIPELEDVEAKHLHEWDKYHQEYDVDYPKPTVNYKKQRETTIKMYKLI